ncbi:hypothetical protein ACH40E_35920 [Streptomyces acidicola]|uniref:hypothetical protein n=1 Tax=Streptomyces acidicola TaxID=2596892 RepID=UPI003795DE95
MRVEVHGQAVGGASNCPGQSPVAGKRAKRSPAGAPLPAAHITLSYVTPDLVTVQAPSWAALEAWRVALNVSPSEVQPGNCASEREHIEFEGIVDGARVRVYVMGGLVETAAAEDSAVAA